MSKVIRISTGHTLHVSALTFDELPASVRANADAASYARFYVARNFDEAGVSFFYLAKGDAGAPLEVVVFYPNGKMWSGFGRTLQAACDGAVRDGWLYAH